jgi:hypothetical protein
MSTSSFSYPGNMVRHINHLTIILISSQSNEREREGGEPAFSCTVPDQFKIVYSARMIAPTGSNHQ